MTQPNLKCLDQITACHSRHGQAWAIIENAGRQTERQTGGAFPTFHDAVSHRDGHYEPDEITDLSVDVARWEPEGRFWSYDY